MPVVQGIKFQLNQLFLNLLSNALKFSKAEERPVVKILCSELKKEEQDEFPFLSHSQYYKIEVKDNGIGFDPQYAEKIFVVFQRLHIKELYSGNGIGLAICKKIVQNHKGSIYAQSTPGEGASFVVLLPKTID
ncbi:MAG: hypothetical protein EON98_03855 [Chitinophagaceae bacterium]|nr:MAG: hypothetical protein EON98_03855 [Chitinophagaceae bacterium]